MKKCSTPCCRWLFVIAAAMFLSGCATPQDGEVSSIPWNRPQSWEGGGALGGYHPPGSP